MHHILNFRIVFFLHLKQITFVVFVLKTNSKPHHFITVLVWGVGGMGGD